ncbi:MAG: ADP-glyceromanno-heptose 6-epimerase [Syntrophaceae bacterium]|nr:ADP-glyceromanno-heptose 6-epimerase [Syntrophaceae bacterium]
MIIVTGGAGFIGSNLVKALNDAGESDILIVDRLGKTDKWKNLTDLNYRDYEHKDQFILKAEKGLFEHAVRAVIHLGACSSTTELDADYLMDNNFCYSRRLANIFAARPGLRFVYASSAATYGDGAHGYCDEHDMTHILRPLNMYGYSKQLFDLWAMKTGFIKYSVGLKYFNVFGPNEYHKDDMRSVAIRAYFQARDLGKVKLFKSYKKEYADGEQLRDFIYVKDAVQVTMFFLEHPDLSGIYNVGTGKPSSFNQLANAVFSALNLPVQVEYIDMPEGLEKRYQYYTCANTSKLLRAGYNRKFMEFTDSVKDYIQGYLLKDPRSKLD